MELRHSPPVQAMRARARPTAVAWRTLVAQRFAAALAIAAALSAPAWAQEAPLRVVVLPFDAQEGVSKGDAAAITELVRSAIAVTNEFSLIENQASQAILAESGFGPGEAGLDEASRALAERLNAAYALAGAVSAQDKAIVMSVRLIDAATARVVFVHQVESSESAIHREARLFAEGIANSVVAMTAGATAANIGRLLELGRLDEAALKLDAARARAAAGKGEDPAVLAALRDELGAGLAERAWRASKSASSRAAKAKSDPEAKEELMSEAREEGTDALFLVPDGPDWAKDRERYLSYMRDSVMSYYAAADKARRAVIAKRAAELVKAGDPDAALAAIADYVELAGERSIDKSLKAAMDRASKAKSKRLLASARKAAGDGDYRMATRLLDDAASAGTSSERLAREFSRIEAVTSRLAEAEAVSERRRSAAWDPAARRPWSAEVGLDLAITDEATAAWPLGGVAPMARIGVSYAERVSGPILFELRLSGRAGSADWSGPIDIGEASVSYSFGDASLQAGFIVTAAKVDASIGAAAVFGVAGYHGELEVYGSTESVSVSATPYLGASIRGAVSYKPSKRFGFGVALERKVGFSPNPGLVSGLAIGFSASITP